MSVDAVCAANKSTTAIEYAQSFADTYASYDATAVADAYPAAASSYAAALAASDAAYDAAFAYTYANAYAFAFGYSSVSSANLNNYAVFIQSNIVTIMPFMVALMNGTTLTNIAKLLSIDTAINNSKSGAGANQAGGGHHNTGGNPPPPPPPPPVADLTITTVPYSPIVAGAFNINDILRN